MTIEIHQPRLEALIEQRMASGRYASVEDALLQALELAPLPEAPYGFGRRLVEVCAELKDMAADVDFSRETSADRLLDLS